MKSDFERITLPKVISSMSYDSYRIKIDHKMLPLRETEPFPDTKTFVVSDEIAVTDKIKSEKIYIPVDIVEILERGYTGYRVSGVNRQMLDVMMKTYGWHFLSKKMKNKPVERTVTYTSYGSFSYTLCVRKSGMFSKAMKDSLPLYVCVEHTGSDKYVELPVFLKALTGESFNDIATKIGFINPFIAKTFSVKEPNYRDCVEACDSVFRPNKPSNSKYVKSIIPLPSLESFSTRLLGNSSPLNNGKTRLLNMMLFITNVSGCILAEDIILNGNLLYKNGIILTDDILEELDYSPINRIVVRQPLSETGDDLGQAKLYTFLKYDSYVFRGLNCGYDISKDELIKASHTDSIECVINGVNLQRSASPDGNTVSLIYGIINLYLNYINGFALPYDLNSLDEQSSVSWENAIISDICEKLVNINDSILDIPDDTLPLYGSVNSQIASLRIHPRTLLDKVMFGRSKDQQMASLTNITSLLSVDAKSFKDVNQLAGNSVENLSTNWTYIDLEDVPESQNYAKVFYKTWLSRIEQDGSFSSPFVRVRNGVIGEIEYLNSFEFGKHYVAEWDETFHNSDGTIKEKVKAIYQGTMYFIDISKVTYMFSSPIQTSGVTSLLQILPQNEAPKRRTMSCNQVRQGVPLIRCERPVVCSGGESIVATEAYVTAKSILQESCDNSNCSDEQRARILQFKLAIMSWHDDNENRVWVFKAYNKDDTDDNFILDWIVPTSIVTSEKNLFGYKLNTYKGTEYSGDDKVFVYIASDVRDYNIVKHVNYGHMPIDDNIYNHSLALGINALVAYGIYGSGNIDDAMIISSRLVDENLLTSYQMYSEDCKLLMDNNEFGYSEQFGFYDGVVADGFESTGIPKVGTMLEPGSVIIYKYRKRKDKNTGQLRSLPSNVDLPNIIGGQVISSNITRSTAIVTIALPAVIEVGDKLAGRHGNKGIISRIVPWQYMPWIEDTNEIIDIMMNPLGVPSRSNIGQILETVLGYAGRKNNCVYIVSPYQSDSTEFIKNEALKAGITPMYLRDGATGRRFDRPMTVGVQYIYKLHHTSASKIHSIGMSPKLSPGFYQPSSGGPHSEKGQAMGEMEIQTLYGVGAFKVAQDVVSIQSDDVDSYNKISDIIEDNPHNIEYDGINHNDLSLSVFLMSIGISLELENGSYIVRPLKDANIWRLNSEYVHPESVKDNLSSMDIFGDTRRLSSASKSRYIWSFMPLGTRILHPYWLEKVNIANILFADIIEFRKSKSGTGKIVVRENQQVTRKQITMIMKCELFVEVSGNKFSILDYLRFSEDPTMPTVPNRMAITGMSAVVKILDTYDLQISIDKLRIFKGIDLDSQDMINDFIIKSNEEAVKSLYYAIEKRESIKRLNKDISLSDYVVSAIPIVPLVYRQSGQEWLRENDFDMMYKHIAKAIVDHTNSKTAIGEYNIYTTIADFIGVSGDTVKSGASKSNVVNVKDRFTKKKHNGLIRTMLLRKRQQLSGRAVISPSTDPDRGASVLGIPYVMAIDIWKPQLVKLLRDKLRRPMKSNVVYNILKFAILRNYQGMRRVFPSDDTDYVNLCNEIINMTDNYSEQRAVVFGRQPTLHDHGIKAFKPLLQHNKVIELDPLNDKGYNADYDGDQGYVFAPLTDTACEQALSIMSPEMRLKNVQDNTVMMGLTQDMLLGVYYATMLKNNELECVSGYTLDEKIPKYFPSVDILLVNVDEGKVNFWEFVTVNVDGRNYISTAGRILFNSLLPFGFTDKLYTDPYKIFTSNYTEQFNDDNKPINSIYSIKYDAIITGVDKSRIGYIPIESIYKELMRTKFNNVVVINGRLKHNIRVKIRDKTSRSSIIGNIEDNQRKRNKKILDIINKMASFGFKCATKSGISFTMDDLKEYPKIVEYLNRAEQYASKVDDDYQRGLLNKELRDIAMVGIYDFYKQESFIKGFIDNLGRNNNIFLMFDSKARGSEQQAIASCGIIGLQQKTATKVLEIPIISNYLNGVTLMESLLMSYGARLSLGVQQLGAPVSGRLSRAAIYLASGIKVVEHSCSSEGINIELEYMGSFSAYEVEVDGKFEVLLPENLVGEVLIDPYQIQIVQGLLEDGNKLTLNAIKVLVNRKFAAVHLQGKVAYSRLKLSQFWKSFLLYRCYIGEDDLPALKQGRYISNATIRYIEKTGMHHILVRAVVSCESEEGICQLCYGLKFENDRLPYIGEYVGIRAAQYVSERTSQLTISQINTTVAGENVAESVHIAENIMENNSIYIPITEQALVSPVAGIISINRCDNGDRIISVGDDKLRPTRRSILVLENEWVGVGTKLTSGIIHPYTSFDFSSMDGLILRRLNLTKYLFSIFNSQKLGVNVRYYEILARARFTCVKILSSDTSDVIPGSLCDASIVKHLIDEGYNISYYTGYMTQFEALAYGSGPITNLSMNDAMGRLADMHLSGLHYREKSLIGMQTIGTDFVTQKPRPMPNFLSTNLEPDTHILEKPELPKIEVFTNPTESKIHTDDSLADDFFASYLGIGKTEEKLSELNKLDEKIGEYNDESEPIFESDFLNLNLDKMDVF